MSEQENKSLFQSNVFICFVFLCLIGLIVCISIPNYIGPRRSGPAWNANCCINNLRQIDAAANQFALEKGLKAGDKINFPNDLTPFIKLNKDGKITPCSSGGIYSIKKVGDYPTCSLGTSAIPAHALQ